ncbi:MAG: hypothetical protein HS115_08485 [Spirochaetales bacterium]|nr:hypothetical protein [Spirochaetales bacterium]
MNSFRYTLLWLLAGSLFSLPANPVLEAVYSTEVVRMVQDPARPWAVPTTEEVHGSATLIAGSAPLFLTDYHLVKNATSILIKKDGQSWPARVAFLAGDAGIAVLRTLEATGKRGLILDDQEGEISAVMVYGYRSPGVIGQVATVVSAVERGLLPGSDVDRRNLLRLDQLPDLSGFRGGPVVQQDRLIGLLLAPHRSKVALRAAEIRHVLADIADGRYDGFPDPGVVYRSLTGAAERKHFGIENAIGGIYLSRISRQSSFARRLKSGDILYEINRNPINTYGEVVLPLRRYDFLEYLSTQQKGAVSAKVIRNGEKYGLMLDLSALGANELRRERPLPLRRFFSGAGLVFQEVDYEIVHRLAPQKSRIKYRYKNYIEEDLSQESDADVTLIDVLPDSINRGSGAFRLKIVEAINGERVRSLDHLVSEWKRSQGRFVVIKFLDESTVLSIERLAIPAAEKRIALGYQIQPLGRVE